MPAIHLAWHQLWAAHHHHHDDADDHESPSAPDADHGANSLAHRGVAALPPGVVLVIAPPTTFLVGEPTSPRGLEGDHGPACVRARDPPSNS